tara:strand:+ start:62695 stop:64359 length:1665 start_codon:yes stop_codon:yes gene_type:complete
MAKTLQIKKLANGHLLLLYLLFLPLFSFSQVFTLTKEKLDRKVYLDSSSLFVYEDVTNKLFFKTISAQDFQSNFTSISKDTNYAENSAVWLKFTIQNSSHKKRDYVLFSNDWDVQFFSRDSLTDFFNERQGVLLKKYNTKFYSGELMDGKIVDHLLPEESRTYYVKTPGLLTNVSFKNFDFISIVDKEIISKKALVDLWSISIYVGILFLILLANTYLLITSFRWSNVYYGFYCLSYVFFFTGYYQIPNLFSYNFPIAHSIFLPLTASLYLLFIINYLSLDKHKKLISKIFKVYIVMSLIIFLGLFYLQATDMVTYYKLLPKVNISNLVALVISSIFIITTPGKLKYFIFIGIFFIITTSLFTWYIQFADNEEQTFRYSIIGNGLEMISFLFGIFYLHKQEQLATEVKLLTAHKELEFKKQQLENFSKSIKEKNKLIEQFEKQIEKSEATTEEKEENLQQLTNSIILTEEDWRNFKKLYEEVHPNFFYNLKNDYPKLTNAEIRLLTLLKLNLSNKEIASMLGISPESVIKTKYRLKKKLSGQETIDLETIISSI